MAGHKPKKDAEGIYDSWELFVDGFGSRWISFLYIWKYFFYSFNSFKFIMFFFWEIPTKMLTNFVWKYWWLTIWQLWMSSDCRKYRTVPIWSLSQGPIRFEFVYLQKNDENWSGLMKRMPSKLNPVQEK